MSKDQVKITVCRSETGKEYYVAQFSDPSELAIVYQMRSVKHHNVLVMHLFGEWGRLDKSRYHGLAHAFMVGDSLPFSMFPSSSDLKSILALHSQDLPQGVDGDYLDQACSKARDAISLQWGIKFNPLIRNNAGRLLGLYPQCGFKRIVRFTREAFSKIVTTTIPRKASKARVNWETVQGYIRIALYYDSIRLANKWTLDKEKYVSLDAPVNPHNKDGVTYEEVTPSPTPEIPPSVPDISCRYKDPVRQYIAKNPEKGAAESQRLLEQQGHCYQW